VSTVTGVTVVVSTFVGWTIVVSTVPEAVSVFVTGSFEIGMRVDERVDVRVNERVVFAGHLAVGFAPMRHVAFVVSVVFVLCAIDADIAIIVNATATPIALIPFLRLLMLSSVCFGSFIVRRPKTVAGGGK
jgi:hypothetical protein